MGAIEDEAFEEPAIPVFPPPGDYGAAETTALLCVPALGEWIVHARGFTDRVNVRQDATGVIVDEEDQLRARERDLLDAVNDGTVSEQAAEADVND